MELNMKNKIISIFIIMIIIGAIIANQLITYARVSETSLFVKLEKTDLNGIGYGNGNPNPDSGSTSNKGEYIWNLIRQESLTGPTSQEQKDLYCVKADYGKTWFTEGKSDTILEYNLNYDIQEDREWLLTHLQDNANDAEDVIKALLNPTGTQYKQLLWIFDNSYVKGTTNIDEYLTQIGIFSGEHNGEKYYYKEENGTQIEYPQGEPLTEADIIAIQKMAIWYFTNGEEYDKTGKDIWLFATSNGTNYEALKVLSESRHAMAMDFYKYLIDGAKKGASLYTPENNYQLTGTPANVDTTGLEQENNKYILNMKRHGENYLVGPIKINKNNDLNCKIDIKVTNQKGETLEKNKDYVYSDSNGNELKVNEQDLIGIPDGFYVRIPRNLIKSVNISIDISYKTTTKKLWLQGTEKNDIVKLEAEQPLVELEQKPNNTIVEFITIPEEFDLSLRKYITEVNGKKLVNTRVPKISYETLQNGTTATYKHRKDPVVVQDKSEITYNITIYNEGNKAGYAKQIIDQLPTGLINSTNNTKTLVSKDPKGNIKNQYTVSYNTTTNQIVLTIVNTNENPAKVLQPYEPSKELDYETIEVKCKVAQEPNDAKQIILTNVAWIDIAYNADDDNTITTQIGEDRDSEPGTKPSVNKDNMENYTGNKENQQDLSNSEYFYKGEQDDDDFEKVVIMPIEKKFDLALFKHISAISKDPKIENGEYITDTGNIDGKYLRAPIVTAIDKETGKITYKENDKTALSVEPGDYVLYTIRVYNEGDINGYASKIKDTLPLGLEFVTENEEYNGIWKLEGLDADGRQIVTTTWYAKGQGAELNSVPGDENYKANMLTALDKNGKISNEEPANPDFLDAQILCKVTEKAESKRVLVNYAQISDDSDENGKPVEDVDSTPDEWIETDDDQDIERIQLQYFDLSLRKFITALNGKELKNKDGKYSREPVVDLTPLQNGKDTTAIYNHPKKPVYVRTTDKIVYTIRAYNEGNIKASASEIKDFLPPYLTFVEDSEINRKYQWKVSEDGRVVTSTYLADKELDAFNGTKLDYEDIQIECIVSEKAPLKQVQTNIAEISKYTYNGGTADKDIDSIPDNMKNELPSDEKLPTYKDDKINDPYVPGNEDDDDFEKVYVQEFDLSLLKFVSKVIIIENGKQTITETGYNGHEDPEPVVKVELHKKKLDEVVVKFGYGITITNEGCVPGYAKEITDYVPQGLKFDPNDNPEWTDEGNNVISTRQLENVLLQPGESKTVEVILTWINGKDNLALKTNTAEISEDDNEYDLPDRDSTPDNKKEGEDDIDIAKVILTISTGAGKTYFMLTLGLLAIIATGIFLIKKFVI